MGVRRGHAGSVPFGVAAAGRVVVADTLVVGQQGWPPQHGGTTGLVAAVEAPLPYPGGLENGLVVDLARHHLFTDLAPLQELGLHVAVGVDVFGVD